MLVIIIPEYKWSIIMGRKFAASLVWTIFMYPVAGVAEVSHMPNTHASCEIARPRWY